MHVRAGLKSLAVAALQVGNRLVCARFDCNGDAPLAGRDTGEARGVAARLCNGPMDPVARLLSGARAVRDCRDAALRASRQREELRAKLATRNRTNSIETSPCTPIPVTRNQVRS